MLPWSSIFSEKVSATLYTIESWISSIFVRLDLLLLYTYFVLPALPSLSFSALLIFVSTVLPLPNHSRAMVPFSSLRLDPIPRSHNHI